MTTRRFLRLNGAVIPVSPGSANVSFSPFDLSSNNFENTPRKNKRRLVENVSFQTSPMSAVDAKSVEGMIQGRGAKWNFSQSYGIWSTSGHRIVDFSGSVNYIENTFGFPGSPVLTGEAKSKFGYKSLTLGAGSSITTDLQCGLDGEYTVFCFSTVGYSGASDFPRYAWLMNNSDGDAMINGEVVAFNWLTPSIVSSTAGDVVSISSSSEVALNDLVILPFVVTTSQAVDIFKSLSCWDLRMSLAFENSLLDEGLGNIATSVTAAASGGAWGFNDREGDAPGSCVFDFGSTISTDIAYTDFANWYEQNGYSDDSPLFARPRSISVWIKFYDAPTVLGVGVRANIFTRTDNGSPGGFQRGFVVDCSEDASGNIRVYFSLHGEDAGGAVSVELSDDYGQYPGQWVNYIFTIKRPVTGDSTAYLYKNGRSVSSSVVVNENAWIADPTGEPWRIGGTSPAGTSSPVKSCYLGGVQVFGWDLDEDDAFEVYSVGNDGANLQPQREYGNVPSFDLSGSFMMDKVKSFVGDSSTTDFLSSSVNGAWTNNLKTVSVSCNPSGVVIPDRPSDEIVPADTSASPANPFTLRLYPGQLFGTRPDVRMLANGSYHEPTVAIGTGKAWAEGPCEFMMSSEDRRQSDHGPFRFDRSEYFWGNNTGIFMLGAPYPSSDSYGSRFGRLMNGKSAVTVLMWVRPESTSTALRTFFRSSVNTSGNSKIRLDIATGASRFLRVGGRSDNADSFHSATGTVDLNAISDNGSDWIQVGCILDCGGDRLYAVTNGSVEDLGAFGMLNPQFDDSHFVTCLGTGYGAQPSLSWIYSLDFYSRKLSDEEIEEAYQRQKDYFVIKGSKGF